MKDATSTRKDSRLPLVELVILRGPIKRHVGNSLEEYVQLKIENIGYGLARNIFLWIPDREPIKVGNLAEGEDQWVEFTLNAGEIKRITDLAKADKILRIWYDDIFDRQVGTLVLFDVKTNSSGSQSWIELYVDSWTPIIPN